jgi:UDP-GlcNAc3NAcA epimerase
LTVVGARPQFVKAATVSRELARRRTKEVIVHTGQHYDINMSDVFFSEMDIPRPDYHLNVNGLAHGAMTGQMMSRIEEVLMTEKPDCVLVYGDTNSTLAGALAAVKLHIPVAHVEAGLRSFNMEMPEEVNRILTDRISSMLYCPTQNAVDNLRLEGFVNFPAEIVMTGDVMYDAALYYREKATALNTLERLNLSPSNYYLCTFHRAENTDNVDNLKQIVSALNELSESSMVIVPIHPRTKSVLDKEKIRVAFRVIEPVGYFDMINLIRHSKLVLTDSGGLQKEAFFFQRPCVTMRDQTEWVELVSGGFNKLSGANARQILDAVKSFDSVQISDSELLYGSGDASQKIVEHLIAKGRFVPKK